jgi:ubiquinone/menaquinone biosynthesis C-methylase UbiE
LQNAGQTEKLKVMDVDISKGMLDIAREKFGEDECKGLEVKFLEGDIANLTRLEDQGVTKGSFDIITICSALVLLRDTQAAIQHWAQYLKPGGRMVVDIPHNKSMLSNKIPSLISPDFGIRILGDWNWIKGVESLERALDVADLKAEVIETDIFDDIPARTEVKIIVLSHYARDIVSTLIFIPKKQC